jgi:hypothetical protein
VLEAVHSRLDAVSRLLRGGDVGEDTPVEDMRLGDERGKAVPAEAWPVTGDGAVDDLDDVHVVVLDQVAQLPATVDRIADLDGEVPDARGLPVHDRPDRMAPRCSRR